MSPILAVFLTVALAASSPGVEVGMVADAEKCSERSNVGLYAGACKGQIDIEEILRRTAGETATLTSSSEAPRYRFQRREYCGEWFQMTEGTNPVTRTWPGEIPACSEPWEPADMNCPDDAAPLPPLWSSPILGDDTFGPWEQVTGYQCAVDPLPAAIAAAWRAMDITPTTYTTQPANGWAIASMGIIPVANAQPQTENVTVLGTPVTLRATPTEFTWTTPDGTTHTTNGDTGGYESGAEPITFERREHRTQLNLTTTWEGHYSLNGGTTWTPAPGTATTTSDTTSIHIYNPRARLVDCDTSGNCTHGTRPATTGPTLTDPDADGIDNHLIPDHHIDHYLDTRDKGRTWTRSERRTSDE